MTTTGYPPARLIGLLAAQSPSDGVDQVGRQMGQVAERLMLDLTVLAVVSSQEMNLVDLPFVRASSGGYVYFSVSAWYTI